jgi:rhamnogalacturonyl hydrolase YesR
VYALAYGINSGLLEKEVYLPVVLKGWQALEDAVAPDGKLGWVQFEAASPQETSKEMTEAYGAGAFLLAGSEVYRLSDDK